MISQIDAELEWLQQLIELLYTRQYQVERDFHRNIRIQPWEPEVFNNLVMQPL